VNRELRAEIMRRIQMERDLIESRRFVQRITDATPNLLYLYDIIDKMTIYINPRVEEILGYTPDAVKRMGNLFFGSAIHPDDIAAFDASRARLAAAGEGDIVEVDYRMKNSSGEWRWFSSRDVVFKMTAEGNAKLILGIAQDITEMKRAVEELRSSREQLRLLLAHAQTVREEERARISREIHDELGQALTALKMDLSWLLKRLDKDEPPLRDKALSMTRLVDANIQMVKRIAAELRPGVLDNLGLTDALEWQAKDFEKRTGISCKIAIRPRDIRLDRNRSTAIFRIFQETLTNVARHAGASRVTASLTKDRGKVRLFVKDDGKGITAEEVASASSIGLIGMKERVGYLGGKVKISGSAGKGTSVSVSIPFYTE
jgi:PAS domain S-box-containing protein